MPWIHWPGAGSPSGNPVAAIAVVSPDGTHTGIVYLDENGTKRFIHLAFHFDLHRDSPGSKIGWVLPASEVPTERLEHVAAMCERVWERHQTAGVPYGFRYDATRFREDGALELGTDERGLTCATFILAIYRSVGLELLRLSEWPVRPDDEARFVALLALLRKHCHDLDHIEAVSKETKTARYRPLEVAAGSRYAPPATYKDSVAGAAAIEAELKERESGT